MPPNGWNVAVPVLTEGAGGLAEMYGAQERQQKQTQANQAYVTAIQGAAKNNPSLKFLADAAAQDPAIAEQLFGSVSNLYPDVLKQQQANRSAQAKRNTVMGILQERIQREQDPAKLRDYVYWMSLVADPNTDPAMYDKAIEHFAPKDPTATMDNFDKWARDKGIAIPTDQAGRTALYAQYTADLQAQAGGRAGAVAAAQLPYAGAKAEETAAGRTRGSLEATRAVAAPDVLATANDLESTGAKIFPAHAGFGVMANAAKLAFLRRTGDPNVKAFDAARSTLIDYAKLLAAGNRLTKVEFEQINTALNSDNLSMDAIRQVTQRMRAAANRVGGGGVATHTATGPDGRKYIPDPTGTKWIPAP